MQLAAGDSVQILIYMEGDIYYQLPHFFSTQTILHNPQSIPANIRLSKISYMALPAKLNIDSNLKLSYSKNNIDLNLFYNILM